MEYQLVKLQEQLVFTGQPPQVKDRKQFNIFWSFNLDITQPEAELVEVKIDASIKVAEPSGLPPIGHFIATHSFRVSPFSENFRHKEEEEQFLHFLATLVGISLGSMRGLAYARTAGVLGPNVFMPVVNPTEMVKAQQDKIMARLS